MTRVARQILTLFVAFAIFGGITQSAGSAGFTGLRTTIRMPCDMAMPASQDHAKPMMPCKGMTPGCIKQMGCVTDVGLPARQVSHTVVVHFTTVDYSTAPSNWTGLVRQPEPLPPRTT